MAFVRGKGRPRVRTFLTLYDGHRSCPDAFRETYNFVSTYSERGRYRDTFDTS